MTTRGRYRVMHKFWLDVTKDSEDWLDEQIVELKRTRKFTTILRDALRLILDLRAGRAGVLLELFPWVAEELRPAGANLLAAEIAELKRLVVAQSAAPLPSLGGAGGALADLKSTAAALPSAFVAQGGGRKVDGHEARRVFSLGLGDLFADDQEDW